MRAGRGGGGGGGDKEPAVPNMHWQEMVRMQDLKQEQLQLHMSMLRQQQEEEARKRMLMAQQQGAAHFPMHLVPDPKHLPLLDPAGLPQGAAVGGVPYSGAGLLQLQAALQHGGVAGMASAEQVASLMMQQQRQAAPHHHALAEQHPQRGDVDPAALSQLLRAFSQTQAAAGGRKCLPG
mmetsp:Transcript_15536/g.39068  ORF Transcript_15536/g.39068 Transcript_15536/m.39068 type:complete len:179 (+) Transcript_15536:587-1123(+)